MKTVTSSVFLLALILLFLPLAAVSGEEPVITGYARTHGGLLLREESEYALFRNTVNLKLAGGGDGIGFLVNPFIYHYPNSELQTGLREAYVDLYFDSLDIRVGKQQIIWGKAEGAFITDVISPRDLRQFILPDFEEIRIGVTAVKADYYIGNSTFEAIFVPVFVPNRHPEVDSIWRIEPPYPVAPNVHPVQAVARTPENGEVFFKYAYLGSAIDFELMGGYMWDDDPALHVSRTIDFSTGTVTGIDVQPEYHRLGLLGGSFSTAVGDVVLRGEGAYYFDKRFQADDPTLEDSLLSRDYIHYLGGIDFTLFDIGFSTQFIQRVILDYEDTIVQEQFENTLTFRASREFLRQTLRLEFFSYLGLNEMDALLRPKAAYRISDTLEAAVGADIFVGDDGAFGRFAENDQAWLRFTYSF